MVFNGSTHFRYFAIVHPLKSRMQQSKGRTCRILIAVWVISCVGSLPNFMSNAKAMSFRLTSSYGSINRESCIAQFQETFRKVYFTTLFVVFYTIPLVLIAFTSFCIARSLLRTSVLRRQGSLLRQEVNRRKVKTKSNAVQHHFGGSTFERLLDKARALMCRRLCCSQVEHNKVCQMVSIHKAGSTISL